MSDLMNVPLTTLTGDATTLEKYSGKVLLIVNVASECGFTPQYTALEETYQKYKDQGFEVLGFPSNDFGGQEPGSSVEIGQFCSSKFSVSFPMFEKVTIVGEGQSPLYKELIAAQPVPISQGPGLRNGLAAFAAQKGLPGPNPAPGVLWNFEKFLVGKDGKVIARFESDIKPDDAVMVEAIEAALKA